jgi:Type II secretory pathway, component PulD
VKTAKEAAPKQAGQKESGISTYEGVKIGGPGGVSGKITLTIKDVFREIITWPEGSSIFLDNRTSTLIVRNTPSNLSVLEQALEVLDVNPPQVMIEARFVEIGADDLSSLGLNINAEVTATGAKSSHTFPFKKDQNTKYADSFSTASNVDFGVLDFSQFQAVLSAIEQNTDSNTLSSPKVTTISGQEAVIKIVKEYRYPTKYEIQTYDSVVGDQARTYYATVPSEFKTRDIGIILKVTPNVGSDGKTINLTLVPEVSEFDINNDMYNFGTTDHPYLQSVFQCA